MYLLFSTATSDYTARVDTRVTFSGGATSRMVRVTLRDDSIYELDEQFRGRLTVEPGSTGVRIDADTATATIIDDDGE